MKLQSLLLGIVVSFGLTAQASNLSLVMYDKPPTEINPNCEIAKKVELKTVTGRSGKRVSYITLTNMVVGFCEIFVNPDPQNYIVETLESSCGSIIYYATHAIDKDESLLLQDHRKRLCEDLRLGLFEMIQSHPAKRYKAYFANKIEN